MNAVVAEKKATKKAAETVTLAVQVPAEFVEIVKAVAQVNGVSVRESVLEGLSIYLEGELSRNESIAERFGLENGIGEWGGIQAGLRRMAGVGA